MTANSATSGHPSPPNGRQLSCHSSTGPTSESTECIAAHRAAALHHLPGGVVLDLLLGPRVAPARWRGRRVLDRCRLNGRGHRGTNTATDHRQSDGVGIPLWTRVSGVGGVEAKWTIWLVLEGGSRRQAAVISTSSISGGPAGALPAEVSRRSQRDLLDQRVWQLRSTPRGPQPALRRQPDSQPVFLRLGWSVKDAERFRLP